MQEKILQLCRRLGSCTINDLVEFIEDENIVIKTIKILEKERLIFNDGGIITVSELPLKSKNKVNNKNLNLMFQFRTDEEIDILIKGFCLGIPASKICYFINVQSQCASDYYCLFRKKIYDNQLKILENLHLQNPQKARLRTFFDKIAYFYTYDKQIFVCEKMLPTKDNERNYTKEEIREFKRVYCYLKRIESRNINENYLYYRLADSIWRHEKSFDYLYNDLKNNLIA